MTGRVLLVGAGPGAADLLTIRAVEALRNADVVLHDRLISRQVLELVPPSAMLVDVGKRRGEDHMQSEILDLIVAHVSAGRVVVRLKGGDPMVFGRGGEELGYLADLGIPVEVIPGVSSAVGVPTAIGLPVTFRGLASGFAVVAGESVNGADWTRYATVDTLVILMGARRRREIAADLITAGRPAAEPVAFIESGTTAQERVTLSTLETVAAGEVSVRSPVIWVSGAVVGTLREGAETAQLRTTALAS